MSSVNPLGLLVNYGDSDEELEDGSPMSAKRYDIANKRVPATYPGYDVNHQTTAPAGIHPAPIPHCRKCCVSANYAINSI